MCRRKQWHPTLVLLPGESHWWRSLVSYSPWGCEESDTAERLHFHFSLSCIGEGNGNPLQYSCLENPRDRGACWAAVYGVAQSWTRLTWLSSSSSSVQLLGRVWLFAAPWTTACQASLSILTPRACSDSCPLSWWCQPTISSSIIPFYSTSNLSQHQGLFQGVGSSHQIAKVLDPQHQSFQWIFSTDFL